MEFELMRLFIVAIMALAFGMGTVACDKKSGTATSSAKSDKKSDDKKKDDKKKDDKKDDKKKN